MYDLIIIGGGPAGLSAGIYAVRRGLKTRLITEEFGKRLKMAKKIENWLGFPSISGPALVEMFVKHAKKAGVEIVQDEVIDLLPGFSVITVKGKSYQAKALILATGTQSRELGVPGEKEFLGRGVSYCATCDAPFYKNSSVVIVGDGNAAAHGALVLREFTDKVKIISEKFQPDPDLLKRSKTKKYQ